MKYNVESGKDYMYVPHLIYKALTLGYTLEFFLAYKGVLMAFGLVLSGL